MALKRKKIGLLFCGGTALSLSSAPGNAVHQPEDVGLWMEKLREFEIMADLKPFFIYGGRAADISSREWIKLARTIYKNLSQFDGFVITHGLETLPYTAIALSLMLRNLNKPVILTGSPLPSEKEKTATALEIIFKGFKDMGVKANLLNALQVASFPIHGVIVAFGSRLIRGSQVIKSPIPTFNFFESFGGQLFGKLDFGITILDKELTKAKGKTRLDDQLDPKVTIFDFHPGIDPVFLEKAIEGKIHGLIVTTHESDYFPEEIFNLLKKAIKYGIAVVIYSASPLGIGERDFIVVNDMSLIATLVKLMWCLGQSKNLPKIKKLMQENQAGEIVRRKIK